MWQSPIHCVGRVASTHFMVKYTKMYFFRTQSVRSKFSYFLDICNVKSIEIHMLKCMSHIILYLCISYMHV